MVVLNLTANMHFILLGVTRQRLLLDAVRSNFRSQATFLQFHEFSQSMCVHASVRPENKRRGHTISVRDVEVTLALTLYMKCVFRKVKNHGQHTIDASCSYVIFYKLVYRLLPLNERLDVVKSTDILRNYNKIETYILK